MHAVETMSPEAHVPELQSNGAKPTATAVEVLWERMDREICFEEISKAAKPAWQKNDRKALNTVNPIASKAFLQPKLNEFLEHSAQHMAGSMCGQKVLCSGWIVL